MISMVDTFCYFNNGELFVKGMNVTSNNVAYSHDPSRDRKLLMKKKELRKLEKELINGLTIVPYRLFRDERGLIKMEIVLAKGKKLWDKRNSIKERDVSREMMRGI
jgi:SsrA-binding protein